MAPWRGAFFGLSAVAQARAALVPEAAASLAAEPLPDTYVLAQGRAKGHPGRHDHLDTFQASLDCSNPCKGLGCPAPYTAQAAWAGQCACMCVKASQSKEGEAGKQKAGAGNTAHDGKSGEGDGAGAGASAGAGSAGAGGSKENPSGASEERKPSGAGETKSSSSSEEAASGGKSGGKSGGSSGGNASHASSGSAPDAPSKEGAAAAQDAGVHTASGYVLSGLPDYDWTPANASIKKPHVLLWVTDDQGWGNVGYHNFHVYTPTMDKLSWEGARLERHYTATWCTPSRASLMTGRMPYHLLQNGGEVVPQDITMLPQVLKKAGYATAWVGKWHLGNFRKWQLPEERGFETTYGFLGSAADYYTGKADATAWPCDGVDMWSNSAPAWGGENHKTMISTKVHGNMVSDIISNHAKTKGVASPLFMYVALQAMHSPLPKPGVNTELYKNFSDAFAIANGLITAADEALDGVVSTLRSEKMWQSTLIIHTADNGGSISPLGAEVRGTNYPLRGGKNTAFEGGVRVPAFIAGGFVPAKVRGKSLHGMVHLADWFPTIANLAGLRNAVPMKTKGEADGMDVWPYLSGEHKLSPRTEVVLSTVSKKTGSVDALISHNWKLVLGHPLCDCFSSRTYPDANSTTGPDALNCNPDHNAPGGVGGETWLFDMEKDPEERKNVAPLFAHKVAELTEILNQRRTSEMKYSDPDSWAPDVEEKCKAYVRSHRGFLGPFFD